MKQYPYVLQKLQIVASSQDANGDFIEGSSVWVDVCQCRNEDGKQRKITVADDIFSVANHLIQCPKGIEALKFGEQIKVIGENSEVRVLSSVIYSSKDQLHTRIWA